MLDADMRESILVFSVLRHLNVSLRGCVKGILAHRAVSEEDAGYTALRGMVD